MTIKLQRIAEPVPHLRVWETIARKFLYLSVSAWVPKIVGALGPGPVRIGAWLTPLK